MLEPSRPTCSFTIFRSYVILSSGSLDVRRSGCVEGEFGRGAPRRGGPVAPAVLALRAPGVRALRRRARPAVPEGETTLAGLRAPRGPSTAPDSPVRLRPTHPR